jgi:N-acetyl-anhydromuramyl-L-alanine amidase AmpD
MIDIPNTHHGPRRQPGAIDLFVIHAHAEWVVDGGNDAGGGAGRIWHCTDWLRAIGLSVHAWCLPDGRIVREVDSWDTAWHAKGFNERSIGMEFVVPGVWTYDKIHAAWTTGTPGLYSGLQLEAGIEWYRARAREHGIPLAPEALRTHHDLDPTRKVDPGRQFPFADFLSEFVR